MKYTSSPVCPDDGEKLALRMDGHQNGPGTWTTGDLYARCPKCDREWVQRMTLEWRDSPRPASESPGVGS